MSSTELDATVADALKRGARMKERLVAELGIGERFPLMVELRRDGVLLGTALPDSARHAILKMVMMTIALSDADHVLLLGEAFAFHAEQEPARRPADGELARWFAAGEPNTHECLQAVSAHRDGRFQLGQHTFHHEGRRVVWDHLHVYGVESTGELTLRMCHGFAMQRTRPFPALSMHEVAAVLECAVLVPRLSTPKRNRPCPCGSGTKAKLCCWA
jgi:hypothetical protein